MSSLDNFNKMSTLFSSAKRFKGCMAEHKEAVESSRGHVDKHAFKFMTGNTDRFNAVQFRFYLEAYRGTYGSSSCYTNTVTSCTQDDMNTALVRWVNKNKQMLLDGVAAELNNMANEALLAAKEEVAKLNAALEVVEQSAKGE